MATRDLDGATVMLLVIGLIPLVGFLMLGHWPRWELGAGAALILFALHELAVPE